MLYSYMTLFDGTDVAHTQIFDQNHVLIHFERANEKEYCFATCELPTYKWESVEGFSAEDMEFLDEYARHNAALIYDFAAKGGAESS